MNRKKMNAAQFVVVVVGLMVLSVMPAITQGAGPGQETKEMAETPETTSTGLPAELKLTDEQARQVEKILKMEQGQAEKDRENFKGNALGLIQAARRRVSMVDFHIENLLTPEQKNVYADYKHKRKQNEELFILTEGLVLSEEQQVKVKIILDEYHEMMKADRDKMHRQMEMGGGGMPGGGMDRDDRGDGEGSMAGGPPGGGMGRGGMRGPGSGMADVFKKNDSKKAKQISKLLTKEQQKMYKDIRKMQQKEMQERMQEQRKRMHR